ncbi:hypothetical protein AKJ44_01535 [candidate division MSBL1 archaeon SCGC-AAA261F17]|uniref:Uncharacterized protein n=1 Tax=candidate division MSBL1 archaeon SCGC-AAA261F17 TaxID=1698274 RepID=A0A133V6H5_9EURY|nr:hypothetical protein AKJ44_01535 [candidate division MSBL1 archaeon SCGC-AAA261F17]
MGLEDLPLQPDTIGGATPTTILIIGVSPINRRNYSSGPFLVDVAIGLWGMRAGFILCTVR